MRFLTRDGVPFEGGTFLEAVTAPRATSRRSCPGIAEFMVAVAAGVELQAGHHVRSAIAADFLADLEAAGLIERVS